MGVVAPAAGTAAAGTVDPPAGLSATSTLKLTSFLVAVVAAGPACPELLPADRGVSGWGGDSPSPCRLAAEEVDTTVVLATEMLRLRRLDSPGTATGADADADTDADADADPDPDAGGAFAAEEEVLKTESVEVRREERREAELGSLALEAAPEEEEAVALRPVAPPPLLLLLPLLPPLPLPALLVHRPPLSLISPSTLLPSASLAPALPTLARSCAFFSSPSCRATSCHHSKFCSTRFAQKSLCAKEE